MQLNTTRAGTLLEWPQVNASNLHVVNQTTIERLENPSESTNDTNDTIGTIVNPSALPPELRMPDSSWTITSSPITPNSNNVSSPLDVKETQLVNSTTLVDNLMTAGIPPETSAHLVSFKALVTKLKEYWNHPSNRWVMISTIFVFVTFIVEVVLASIILSILNSTNFENLLTEASTYSPYCKISLPPPYGLNQGDYPHRELEGFLIEATSQRLYFSLLIFSFCFSTFIFGWSIFTNHALELFSWLFLCLTDIFSVLLLIGMGTNSVEDFANVFPMCYEHVFLHKDQLLYSFQALCIALFSVLVCSFVIYLIMAWKKLRKSVSWKAYEWVGPDKKRLKRVKVHQAFTLLIKLWLFYAIKLAIQVEFFLAEAPAIAEHRVELASWGSAMTLVAIVVACVVVGFGYLAVRLQNFILIILFCVITVVVIGLSIGFLCSPPAYFTELASQYGLYVPLVLPDFIVAIIIGVAILIVSSWNAYYVKVGPKLSWKKMEKRQPDEQVPISMVEQNRNEVERWTIE